MILMLDNYDSFTYNLVRYAVDLGMEMKVIHSDQINLAQIEDLAPTAIILSPGPGTPNQSGVCLDVVRHYAGYIPILGICLGHQVICQVFGSEIICAKEVVHGKTSSLYHSNTHLFYGLPQGFQVTRYHSLVARQENWPAALEVLAWTQDSDRCLDEVMAIKHREFPVYGVQFHPEALLTDYGYEILAAFFTAQGLSVNEQAFQTNEIEDL